MPPRIRRTAPLPLVDYDRIDGLVVKLADLRQQEKVIKVDIKETQDDLVDEMNNVNKKTHITVASNKQHSVNVQTNTSRTINEEKLKRKVGPSIWRKVTTLLLDRKKVDALVASGEIDPVDLADCVDENESAPFIRITTK